MDARDILEIVLTLLTAGGVVIGGIKWFIDTKLDVMRNDIAETKSIITDVKKELKTNGGSSIKDQINRVEYAQTEGDNSRKELVLKVDKMYDILIEYIASHSK